MSSKEPLASIIGDLPRLIIVDFAGPVKVVGQTVRRLLCSEVCGGWAFATGRRKGFPAVSPRGDAPEGARDLLSGFFETVASLLRLLFSLRAR